MRGISLALVASASANDVGKVRFSVAEGIPCVTPCLSSNADWGTCTQYNHIVRDCPTFQSECTAAEATALKDRCLNSCDASHCGVDPKVPLLKTPDSTHVDAVIQFSKINATLVLECEKLRSVLEGALANTLMMPLTDITLLSANGMYVQAANQAPHTWRRLMQAEDLVVTPLGANPAIMAGLPGAAYVDTGASCADAQGIVYDDKVVLSGSDGVDWSVPGKYTLTYSCSEGSESGTATRDVYVTGSAGEECSTDVPPVIELVGEPTIEVTQSPTGTYQDAGAVCKDCHDGTLDKTALITPATVDLANPGVYSVQYTCVGVKGGTVHAFRTVSVLPDLQLPSTAAPVESHAFHQTAHTSGARLVFRVRAPATSGSILQLTSVIKASLATEVVKTATRAVDAAGGADTLHVSTSDLSELSLNGVVEASTYSLPSWYDAAADAPPLAFPPPSGPLAAEMGFVLQLYSDQTATPVWDPAAATPLCESLKTAVMTIAMLPANWHCVIAATHLATSAEQTSSGVIITDDTGSDAQSSMHAVSVEVRFGADRCLHTTNGNLQMAGMALTNAVQDGSLLRRLAEQGVYNPALALAGPASYLMCSTPTPAPTAVPTAPPTAHPTAPPTAPTPYLAPTPAAATPQPTPLPTVAHTTAPPTPAPTPPTPVPTPFPEASNTELRPGAAAAFQLFGMTRAMWDEPATSAMFVDGLTAALCPTNDATSMACFWSDFESVEIAAVEGPAVPAVIFATSSASGILDEHAATSSASWIRPALTVHAKFTWSNCTRQNALALHSLPLQVEKVVKSGTLSTYLGQMDVMFANMHAIGLAKKPEVFQSCNPYIHLRLGAEYSGLEVKINHHTSCEWKTTARANGAPFGQLQVTHHTDPAYHADPDNAERRVHHSLCRHFIDVLGEHECECRDWLAHGESWTPTPSPTPPPSGAPTAAPTAHPTAPPTAPTTAPTAPPTFEPGHAETDDYTNAPTPDPNDLDFQNIDGGEPVEVEDVQVTEGAAV
jgi:hypothetical protein